jgi:hypothetical protein
MDLKETEARNNGAGEQQQQLSDWPTNQSVNQQLVSAVWEL